MGFGRHLGLVAMGAVALGGCAKTAAKQESPPPQVRLATVGVDQVPAEITGVGTVALRREASLGFTSAGRVLRITVNEGDVVRRGQMLATLDTTTVSADLARARAERERALAEYRRSEELIGKGWITRPRLESAKASFQAADAAVASAGFQTSNAAILAPGYGVVLARLVEPGQVVAAGTPVLMIGEEASGYVLRVPLSDRDAARLPMGAPARVRIAALGDAVLAGRIVEIGGKSDRATGTFTIEIGLPDDRRLRSGQIGDATIVARGATTQTIRVPAAAVFAPRAGEGFVYVYDPASRKVRLRKVALGDTGDGGIAVTSGIARGEQVAVSRIDRLADGVVVAPIGAAR